MNDIRNIKKLIKCRNCRAVLVKVTKDGVAFRMPQFHIVNFGGRRYLRLQCHCCGMWTMVRPQDLL